MRRGKISIVGGAGNVGLTCAVLFAERGYADLVLVDLKEDRARGKALDVLQFATLAGTDISVTGTADYEAVEGSDIIVVTAGRTRKPGESRADMVEYAKNIMAGSKKNPGIIPSVALHAPDSMILMVSNPVDVMTYVAYRVSGFPKNRVFGQVGVLDSARFKTLIAKELGVSVKDVQACVLGEHGASMVPLTRHSMVAGIPLTERLSGEQIDRIVERTRNGGGEIVELAEEGAYFAPAAAVREMVEAILFDKKQILPCSTFLEGEYEIEGICIGVPVSFGRDGVEEIVELSLNEEEAEALRESAERIREITALTEL